MRTGMIAAAVMTLGLAAVPSMVNAGEVRHDRVETRTATHETRPVEVRRENRTVVRNVNVMHDDHRDVRVNVNERRDVRVDEHVVIDRDDHHYWDHDRVYIPTPVIVTAAVTTDPLCDTPVGINQVPPAVLNATAQTTGGAPIVSIDWMHNRDATYYDVHVTGPYNTIQTLRFGARGVFFGNI